MTDLISLIAGLAYMVLLGFGIYYARGAASLDNLASALNLYLLAALVQFVALCAGIADTEADGWVPVGISGFNFVVALGLTWFTAQRMNRIGGDR